MFASRLISDVICLRRKTKGNTGFEVLTASKLKFVDNKINVSFSASCCAISEPTDSLLLLNRNLTHFKPEETVENMAD